jgi:hypothetical protein
VPRSAVPSTGQILQEITGGKVDAVEHDKAYPGRVQQTIY